MVCGIYRITNTTNGKFYIGQSKHIYKRWGQHTHGLDRNRSQVLQRGSYPLRSAFLKYGLKKRVTRPGIHGVFKFEVIEKCSEEVLFDREGTWIKNLDPEYNCNVRTPVRTPRDHRDGIKHWVQYHNFERLGYLPGEQSLDIYEEDEISDNQLQTCGISTRKGAVKDSRGDTVFLIVGVGSPKQYFLWSRFTIEEVMIGEEEGYHYQAFGTGMSVESFEPLNDLPGFKEFRKYCGNFGLGFHNIDNSPFLGSLKGISEKSQHNYKSDNLLARYQAAYDRFSEFSNYASISSYMKRGLSRHLTLSTDDVSLLLLLSGRCTVTPVPLTEEVLPRYVNSELLLHNTGRLDIGNDNEEINRELDAHLENFVDELGLEEDFWSPNRIIGSIEVLDAYEYTDELFDAESDVNGCDCSLSEYKERIGLNEDASIWGLSLGEPLIFPEAVQSVFAPDLFLDCFVWTPSEPDDLDAFDLALGEVAALELGVAEKSENSEDPVCV
ncbi:MAG: GIY-YIG nuclease family protein [Synechococcus sp.]